METTSIFAFCPLPLSSLRSFFFVSCVRCVVLDENQNRAYLLVFYGKHREQFTNRGSTDLPLQPSFDRLRLQSVLTVKIKRRQLNIYSFFAESGQ